MKGDTTNVSKTDSPYRTLADLRAANETAGMHFFDRKTMKFWKSRVESTLIRGRYFITSEDEWCLDGRDPQRIFAVRYANDDASISTVRSHIRWKDDAREIVSRLLKGEHVKRNAGHCPTCGQYGSACTGEL